MGSTCNKKVLLFDPETGLPNFYQSEEKDFQQMITPFVIEEDKNIGVKYSQENSTCVMKVNWLDDKSF